MAATSDSIRPSGNSSTDVTPDALAGAHPAGTARTGTPPVQVSATIAPATMPSATRRPRPSPEMSRENATAAATDSARTAGMANRAGARTLLPNTGNRINHAYGGSYKICVPRNVGFGPRLQMNRKAQAN